MTSPSQPSGFAAYFAAQPITSSSPTSASAPLIHGLTSPPRTDSPSDSKSESRKASVSEPLAVVGGYGTSTPVPTPPIHSAIPKKSVNISGYIKRAWKLTHDPELHPKGSIGRGKPKEIRQSGEGVTTVFDPRKVELSYGPGLSKGRKKHTSCLRVLQFQYDSNSIGPAPPAAIVIWGFSPLVTSEQIQTQFRPFGEIQELDYRIEPESGASLGVCRIRYKVDKKDMMSGHVSAKKAVQEGSKIRLGGAFIQIELDKDGLATARRVGEAFKKRHAELAAQAAEREQAAAAKENLSILPKPIPTGPAADRRDKSSPAVRHPKSITPPPPPQSYFAADHSRLDADPRRGMDSWTPLQESSRSRRTSPSPPRGRQKSISDNRYRLRSPEPRSYPRGRSISRDRSNPRQRSRSRERSRDRDDYHYRQRSRSRSRSVDRGRYRGDRLDSRRHSPRRRRSISRNRDDDHRRRSPSSDYWRDERRRSLTPRSSRIPDDLPPSSHDRYAASSSNIDERRPPHSAPFRPGVNDGSRSRERTDDQHPTPNASPPRSRRTPPPSDRDEERGRPRKRSFIPRSRTPSDSSSSVDKHRSTNHERGRRRHRSPNSISRSPPRAPLLSPFISHKLNGRPYVFINDRDLPVRRFSSRDLGLCFKKFHPSVYDDSHGFYIAFRNHQDARDCHSAHGDGKSFIDGYRLRMQLVDDNSTVHSKSLASPPRRKIPVKKTVEEEAVDAILTELKDVFIKDVRSRIVNPMILDFLDPSHYNDAHPKTEFVQTTQQPETRVSIVSPVKEETVPLSRLSKANRIPLLPRFRKKGVGAVKDDSVHDRMPTKADVRPMHHQFNYYSDSEDEDELPHREATVVSDDEDESSRPSRETTSVSTPEPSRIKSLGRMPVRPKDISGKEVESEEDLMKDILDTTKDDVSITVAKRKRVIDFTSSEDEDEPSPSKKVCVKAEPLDEIKVDVPAPKLSKVTTLKTTKSEAAALRRTKKADTFLKETEDSITVETVSEKEVEAQVPAIPKIPEVNLSEIEDDDDILLDLDGVQALVRDGEDYRYILEAMADITLESVHDVWTWSWKQKKIKALNFDGVHGPMKKPEPPAYDRINPTGSARSERYVKIPNAEKSLYLPQRNKAIVPVASEAARKTSRMNRVNNRRLAADMEVQKKTLATESDILRFNQLKARKKQLKFARSPIHDWGLFAMEDIEAHEMVIEYVGEIVRFQVAELREKQYERVGIGSSYLFRVDDENIIDATKSGNIARFINHCCTPNCSAKIIQVQGEKKIVIYADRFIAAGEEITYDYKFPREEVKIPCFCGSAHCKGTLN